MARRISSTAERKIISVSDIFEFDLNLLELNLTFVRLSFSDILTYVFIDISLVNELVIDRYLFSIGRQEAGLESQPTKKSRSENG